MSKIMSLADVQNYCNVFAMQRGRRITHMALPLDEFLGLAADIFTYNRQSVAIPSGTSVPPKLDCLEVFLPWGMVKVAPLSMDGKVLLTHNGVLDEHGHKVASNVAGAGYVELVVGPYRYACASPAASVSHSVTLSSTASPYKTQVDGEWTAQPASEPACVCDSKQLASSGHDSNCAWIAWKRSRR